MSDGFCEQVQLHPRCTKTFPSDLLATPQKRLDYSDYIVLGAVFDRSVDLFARFELSAELAFRQANADGGVDGRRFGMVFCNAEIEAFDDEFETTEEAAGAMALYLVEEMDMPALFASARSSESVAAFQAIDTTGALMVSPSSTSPALSNLDPSSVSDDSPGLLWRTCPSDAFQGKAIAFDMRAPGGGRENTSDTVAVLHFDDSYGVGLYNAFAEEFQARGGGTVTAVPFDAAGFGDAVSEAGTLPVDEVLFVSSNTEDIRDFLDTAANLSGYDSKQIFLTEAAATSEVLGGASSALFENVRATRPKPLDPQDDKVYSSFLASFQATFDEYVHDQIFASNSYDAAWVLAYGAAWALLQEGELTGVNMARGLRKLSDPSGMKFDVGSGSWLGILREFGEGRAVDITGASGPLDYDPQTEETSTNIEIWTIDSGQNITPVYTWTGDE